MAGVLGLDCEPSTVLSAPQTNNQEFDDLQHILLLPETYYS
jgi:hypothetical protein